MDTKFNTRIKINLRPEGSTPPEISYGINQVKSPRLLTQPLQLIYNTNLEVGNHKFVLEFRNKTNETPDMAVIIDSVEIEGITVDRFKWAGIYYPNYPEPWASEQTDLPEFYNSATYLGWNGRWELPFTVPIFTWIHKTENLGWIYS